MKTGKSRQDQIDIISGAATVQAALVPIFEQLWTNEQQLLAIKRQLESINV